MEKIRNIIINFVFKYYFKNSSQSPLSDNDQDVLLAKISNNSDLKFFTVFLDQCATNARNKYLYTNDPIFKGSIMAYAFLKDEINKRKSTGPKKNLTPDEKVVIMKGRGY